MQPNRRNRIIYIQGPAGSGKSRMAQHISDASGGTSSSEIDFDVRRPFQHTWTPALLAAAASSALPLVVRVRDFQPPTVTTSAVHIITLLDRVKNGGVYEVARLGQAPYLHQFHDTTLIFESMHAPPDYMRPFITRRHVLTGAQTVPNMDAKKRRVMLDPPLHA
jgi:hypothetical protein